MAEFAFKSGGKEFFDIAKGVPFLMERGVSKKQANRFIRNAGHNFLNKGKLVTKDKLEAEVNRLGVLKQLTSPDADVDTAGGGGGGGGGGISGAGNGLIRDFKMSTAEGTRELDRIAGVQEEVAGTAKSLAETQLDRYLTTVAPLEDEFIQAARVGRDPTLESQGAASGVSQNFARQREMGIRNLRAAGIQPGSPRYERFLRELGVAESLGRATASRSARLGTRADNDARRLQALNLGRSFTGDTLNAAGTAGNILAGAAGTRTASVGASQVPFQTAADIFRTELGGKNALQLENLRSSNALDKLKFEIATGIHDPEEESGFDFFGVSQTKTTGTKPSEQLPPA